MHVELPDADWELRLPQGAVPQPALAGELKKAARQGADFIYFDEDSLQPGAFPACCKPDFAPDYLRGCNYIGSCYAYRKTPGEKACTEEALDGHDRVLRLTERAARIVHIPRVLCRLPEEQLTIAPASPAAVQGQLNRLGLNGTAEAAKYGCCRTRYAIGGEPLVSILIPNKDHAEDLAKCVRSIREKTAWPRWEILILENSSREPETFRLYGELLADPRIRLVTWFGAFNYAAIINHGARYARGGILLQLNNDTEVISPDWLEEMLMYAQRPDVGAVGAVLYYPDDTVQHAGMVYDAAFGTAHAFRYAARGAAGYMNRMAAVQDVSAVTGACLMVRRDVWERVQGMDERFPVGYNDVDLCLRLRKAGFLVVWTPYAELYHYESKSRGLDVTRTMQQRGLREQTLFFQLHREALRRGDPYYNPQLLP